MIFRRKEVSMTAHPTATHAERKSFVSRVTGRGLLVLFVALAMLLAACGGNGSGTGTAAQPSKGPTTLKMACSPAQGNPDLFNPFFNTNGGAACGNQGFVYETLLYQNLYTGELKGWLASSYDLSSDLTTLTFHMQQGVKWSDGQELTSQDAAFTLNLMKQYPALDSNGLWSSVIKSVTAPDNSTVTVALQHPASTAPYLVGAQTFIVPQHVWQSVSDPAKFANDTNPIGTGPYKLASHSSQLIKYTKNPGYWGTKPQVDQIFVPAILSNSAGALAMAKGDLDWLGSGWDPSLDPSFVNKDPQHNHHWFVPTNTVMLYLNLKKYPFNLLPVRQAISTAINRSALPQGAALYAKPASPSGVVVPTLNSWVSSKYQGQNFTYNPQQAEQYLQQAGFTKGSDGIYADKSGKKLSFSLIVVSAWTDWASDTQNIVNDLKKIGIDAKINAVSDFSPYFTAMQTGTFDAGLCWTNGGPTPYYPFQGMLSSGNSAPVGKAVAGTNFERWSDPATDTLLKQYESSNDQNTQKQAIAGLEDIVANQLPSVPITVNVSWDEYTSTHFTGWPDDTNPYDVGAPYNAPNNEMVVLHLKPV